jgi:hypothetical protein
LQSFVNFAFVMNFSKFFILLCCLVGYSQLSAQSITITGTVYDISGRRPVESVVVSSGQFKAITDSLGRYRINVSNKDSLWFSLFGKTTQKFPIDTISDKSNFNVMIHVVGYDLPEVRVRNNYYKFDSIQNRNDYAKFFNYQPPGIKLSNNQQMFGPAGVSVGLDLTEIINMFRFHRNRNLQFLQNRLLAQEHDKYIDRRFNKRFVQKITHLEGEALQKFMAYGRPSYELLGLLNELELGLLIQNRFKEFKRTN